jgi:TadE-like protein
MRPMRAPAQSLIEFALVAPVLLLLAVAVWDGGSVLREQLILDAAARAGARLAATAYSGPGAIQLGDVKSAVYAAGVDLSLGASDPVTFDPVAGKVTVSHTHALYTPLLRRLWGNGSGTVTLQAQATFYVPVPVLSPTLQPSQAPPAPCTFDLNIPALDNNSGWFSPPFQLATRNEPGYFVDRVLIYWALPPGKNIELGLFANNPFAQMSNPVSHTSPPQVSGVLVTDKVGGLTPGVSVDVTRPTVTAGSTYSAYFYNFGAALGATVATVTFLKAGCPQI